MDLEVELERFEAPLETPLRNNQPGMDNKTPVEMHLRAKIKLQNRQMLAKKGVL